MCTCKCTRTAVKFYCEDSNLPQMEKRHTTDAGYDIRCAEHSVIVQAREQRLVKTGLHVAIPEGYVGLVKSRSGLAVKNGIEVGAGVIDSPYRGEVCVLLHNHSDKDAQFSYGDRIAQLCIIKLADAEAEAVEDLAALGQTDRGSKGFGSSGNQ